MRRFLFALVALAALSSCATRAKQTEEWFATSHDIKPRFEIPGVPFHDQTAAHCGPATLTMALNWAGKPLTVEEVTPEVFSSKMKGSLQGDMISAGRRNGMMAVTIQGLSQLLSELQDEHPVIVFENLAVSWLPQWHYAIAYGYDLPKQEIIMHSGHEANKHWDLSKFERSWMLGDYWGLVILPPGEVAKAAGELGNLTAASSLEQIGQTAAAEKSYQRILQIWPESLGALIGAANIAYQRQDWVGSVAFLRRAVKSHPESAPAWHNLAIAEGAARLRREARQSASRAIELAPNSSKASYMRDLQEVSAAL